MFVICSFVFFFKSYPLIFIFSIKILFLINNNQEHSISFFFSFFSLSMTKLTMYIPSTTSTCSWIQTPVKMTKFGLQNGFWWEDDNVEGYEKEKYICNYVTIEQNVWDRLWGAAIFNFSYFQTSELSKLKHIYPWLWVWAWWWGIRKAWSEYRHYT